MRKGRTHVFLKKKKLGKEEHMKSKLCPHAYTSGNRQTHVDYKFGWSLIPTKSTNYITLQYTHALETSTKIDVFI